MGNANVNIYSLGDRNKMDLGAGAVGVGTQRVVLATDQPPVTVGYTSSVDVTRPADTTAYTAGDAVGPTSAILSFTAMGPAGGRIMITDSRLRLDLASVTSGMTSFRLHLYSASPTAIADNAAWDLVSGDRASYLGFVDLGSPADFGATLFVQQTSLNKVLKLAAASTTLYGVMVTNGAFTPTSAATSNVTLEAVAI